MANKGDIKVLRGKAEILRSNNASDERSGRKNVVPTRHSGTSGTASANQRAALAAGAGPLSSTAADNRASNIANSLSGVQRGSQSPNSFDTPRSSSVGAPTFEGGSTAAGTLTGFETGGGVAGFARNIILNKQIPGTEGAAAAPVPPIFSVSAGGNLVAGIINNFKKGNAVSNTVKVGKIIRFSPVKPVATTAIPTNSINAAATASWLGKLAAAGRNPAIIVSTLMAAIGSYPFAGFIKEEALQTLGFATNSAIQSGNLDLAEETIAETSEILNPDFWAKLKAGVPFVNVLDSLDSFYESAVLKTTVDSAVIADLRIAQDVGESDDEMYFRIAAERAADKERERIDDAAYYAEIERQRQAAKAAERVADEAYWADILSEKESQQVKNDVFDEDYWTEYYKALARARDNSAPSNLKFGLL